jgi:outer membrane protein TolC
MKSLQTLILILALSSFNIAGQDTISLEMCLKAAASTFPYVKDAGIYKSISELRKENLRASWYPSLELNAQATWQSDVVKIDVELPFPGIQFPLSPQDQYRMNIDIKQILYDGGVNKILQNIEKTQAGIIVEETNVNFNILKESVCDLYFTILVLTSNENALNTHIQRLKHNLDIARASFLNGVVLETDVYLIEAEIIKLLQSLSEISELKEAASKALSLRTGLTLDRNTNVALPDLVYTPDHVPNRFENRVFELKKAQLLQSSQLQSAKKLPHAFAFTQFGYGRPGLNMLNDEFDSYYLIGAGLKWQLWDWNQGKKEKKILEFQGNLVENQHNNFKQTLEIAIIQKQALIANRKEKISMAWELFGLRSKITANYLIQMEKGVIRTIDYLTVLNEEILAEIQYESEKILLQKTLSEYLLLKGEL